MNNGVRIKFTKLGKIRFTSHRDVARLFERALRKASVHVAYTEGFSPRPKIAFG
jgi:radical SAM-linked protein